MSIQLKNPIIIPAVPEKVLDRLWIKSMFFSSPTIEQDETNQPKDANINFVLAPYAKNLEETASQVIVLTVSDLFKRIKDGDEELATLLDLIAKYAEEEAGRQGKL